MSDKYTKIKDPDNPSDGQGIDQQQVQTTEKAAQLLKMLHEERISQRLMFAENQIEGSSVVKSLGTVRYDVVDKYIKLIDEQLEEISALEKAQKDNKNEEEKTDDVD